MSWPAFEQHLLDSIVLAFEFPNGFRIQRRALWQPAQLTHKELPPFLLPLLAVRPTLEAIESRAAVVEVLVELLFQIDRKLASRRNSIRRFREHGQIFLGEHGGTEGQQQYSGDDSFHRFRPPQIPF